MRQIEVRFIPSNKKPKCGGVYKLWFGRNYYYVGRTRHLYQRRHGHQYQINHRLNGTLNDRMIDPELDYYKFIIEYLQKNEKCKVIKLEVLAFSDDDEQLVAVEQKWLSKAKKDKYCLNVGFVAEPYKSPRQEHFKYRVVDFSPEGLKKPIKKVEKNKDKKETKRTENEVKKQIEPAKPLTSSERIQALKDRIEQIERDYGRN